MVYHEMYHSNLLSSLSMLYLLPLTVIAINDSPIGLRHKSATFSDSNGWLCILLSSWLGSASVNRDCCFPHFSVHTLPPIGILKQWRLSSSQSILGPLLLTAATKISCYITSVIYVLDTATAVLTLPSFTSFFPQLNGNIFIFVLSAQSTLIT